jgi:hypothetical protein
VPVWFAEVPRLDPRSTEEEAEGVAEEECRKEARAAGYEQVDQRPTEKEAADAVRLEATHERSVKRHAARRCAA